MNTDGPIPGDDMHRPTTWQRRTLLGTLLACGTLPLRAWASTGYPSRPVRLVVPFAAGGTTDLAARLVAQNIGQTLGQPVIVDNRPGAGGTTGSGEVAQRPADGHTLLYGSTSTLATSPALYPNLPYDPGKAFAPVALVARGPQILLVNATLPIGSLPQLVEYGKKQPGKLTFSSGGVGSVGHLSAELLLARLGVSALHVPYRSGSMAINAVIAGETNFVIDAVGTTESYVKAGRLKPLAVLSESRSHFAPELATPTELGLPAVVADFWSGVVAPAGTPQPIVDQLASAIGAALRTPEMVQKLRALGTEPGTLQSAAFGEFVQGESRKWAEVVRNAHIKLD